ncbi:alpha-2-HS-glycoprotein-like [Odontesthes bonariensis]|uniref:alpha-2-HS-glycoprotein-like n=1 Tax=Odontesthes bonariensis TaxID=219752 RepID=UPI003F58ACD5
MNLLGITVVLGLVMVTWAQVKELRPPCDSPEVEEAALVARDYLNAQHTHFYKYALNRIEEIKIRPALDGNNTYILDIELLETDCHVLDPTPVANCTVRPKVLTAIEGDCEVVLERVAGVLTVTAFKCKTEESTEDMCIGCSTLLPLNHTAALEFVQASLTKLNNRTENITYTILEVGRMSSKIVTGGPRYAAEYIVIEANCINDTCVPLNDIMAARGICSAEGLDIDPTVDCKMFSTLMPLLDANSTAAAEPALPPLFHIHLGSLSPKHGLRHHKLTALHDPLVSGLLSAESAESAEVVPVAPAVTLAAASADPAPTAAPADPAPTAADSSSASDASASAEVPLTVVKRELPASLVADVAKTDPASLVQLCPGRIRFF